MIDLCLHRLGGFLQLSDQFGILGSLFFFSVHNCLGRLGNKLLIVQLAFHDTQAVLGLFDLLVDTVQLSLNVHQFCQRHIGSGVGGDHRL